MNLKEDPREWRKFTWTTMLAFSVICVVLTWRRVLPLPWLIGLLPFFGLMAVTGFLKPVWFRGFYRGGMTVSFRIGQFVSGVLLALLFFVVVTPFGVLLHFLGKDLLRLKRRRDVPTYWLPARNPGPLDRLF